MSSRPSQSKPLIRLDSALKGELVQAAKNSIAVTGLTHNFYRYPARFSPALVRAAINAFTEPGDLVLDPFVGGGTTLVEALASGRNALGTDISALAGFITEVKTTIHSAHEFQSLSEWADAVAEQIDMHANCEAQHFYKDAGYLRNLDGVSTWRLRKAISQSLSSTRILSTDSLQKFARCAVLRTAQWALDGRKTFPSITSFRRKITQFAHEMIDGSRDLAIAAENHGKSSVFFSHQASSGLEHQPLFKNGRSPRLVITSPPYPGVHVLYHRWQIHGGRETPAPFWIADRLDGDGAAYYTMGDRKTHAYGRYFVELRTALDSIAAVCNEDTTIVQVVAFSDPARQLPRYLSVADDSGFEECFLTQNNNAKSAPRLRRRVPNRKWYASQKGHTSGSQEIVLFHRLKR